MTRTVKAPLFAFALAASATALASGPASANPYGQQGGGCPAMMGHGMMGCPMMQQGMGYGTMGRHGMHGMMGQGGMHGNPVMHVMMMMAAADTDGDEAVSFDEVTVVHRRMFDMADTNKDGKLDRDEAMAVLSGRDRSPRWHRSQRRDRSMGDEDSSPSQDSSPGLDSTPGEDSLPGQDSSPGQDPSPQP